MTKSYLNLIQTKQGIEFDVCEGGQNPPITFDARGDRYIASYVINADYKTFVRPNIIQPILAKCYELDTPKQMAKLAAKRLAKYRRANLAMYTPEGRRFTTALLASEGRA